MGALYEGEFVRKTAFQQYTNTVVAGQVSRRNERHLLANAKESRIGSSSHKLPRCSAGHPTGSISNQGVKWGQVMSTSAPLADLEHVHNRWGWFLALGIALIVLGIIALAYIPAATLGSVLVLGWLMIASGIVEAVYAFQARRWGGVLLHLLGGVLGVLLGLLVVTHPAAGALAWTLLFAAFFTVIGLFRTIAAIQLKFRNWGWAVFDGIVTLVLGILLWAAWPSSAIWFLGFALGVALILRGWTTVMFALAVRAVGRVIPIRRVA